VVADPVSHVWLEPDSDFSPDKPVTCRANGYPRPTFEWVRAMDNVTVSRGAKLDEKSTNYAYRCQATNTVRRQTYTVMSDIVNYNAASGIILTSYVHY